MEMMKAEPEGKTGIPVSRHGIFRIMERLSCGEKQARNVARKAWERGASMDQLPLVKQRKFLQCRDGRFAAGATQFRVYQGFLFIFAPDGKLVTMYSVPNDFLKRPLYVGKKRVRHFRYYEQAKRMEDAFECAG